MATDWIRMRTDLYRHPKVIMMAANLINTDSQLARFVNQNCQCDLTVTMNVMRNAVIGGLLSVWGTVRHAGKRVGNDLVLDGLKVGVLSEIADLCGFGQAMEVVGWVVDTTEGILLPDFFEELNTDPNEAKSANAARQQRFRDSKKESSVTEGVTRNVTEGVTRNVTEGVTEPLRVTLRNAPEKRREENIYSAPPPNFIGGDPLDGQTPGLSEDPLQVEAQFSAAWNACSSVSSKLRSGLPHNLRKTFWLTWNDPEWRAVLWRALERIKQPLPGGKRFKIQNFLEQTTLQDLAEGTHSWLMGHGTDQGKPRLMTDEEKENWRP